MITETEIRGLLKQAESQKDLAEIKQQECNYCNACGQIWALKKVLGEE